MGGWAVGHPTDQSTIRLTGHLTDSTDQSTDRPVSRLTGHLIDMPTNQSVTRLTCHSPDWSPDQPPTRHATDWSTDWLVTRLTCQSTNRLVNKQTNQSTNQPIGQPSDQPTNWSTIGQPTDRLTDWSVDWPVNWSTSSPTNQGPCFSWISSFSALGTGIMFYLRIGCRTEKSRETETSIYFGFWVRFFKISFITTWLKWFEISIALVEVVRVVSKLNHQNQRLISVFEGSVESYISLLYFSGPQECKPCHNPRGWS